MRASSGNRSTWGLRRSLLKCVRARRCWRSIMWVWRLCVIMHYICFCVWASTLISTDCTKGPLYIWIWPAAQICINVSPSFEYRSKASASLSKPFVWTLLLYYHHNGWLDVHFLGFWRPTSDVISGSLWVKASARYMRGDVMRFIQLFIHHLSKTLYFL